MEALKKMSNVSFLPIGDIANEMASVLSGLIGKAPFFGKTDWLISPHVVSHGDVLHDVVFSEWDYISIGDTSDIPLSEYREKVVEPFVHPLVDKVGELVLRGEKSKHVDRSPVFMFGRLPVWSSTLEQAEGISGPVSVRVTREWKLRMHAIVLDVLFGSNK
jgi:hypothetical protein